MVPNPEIVLTLLPSGVRNSGTVCDFSPVTQVSFGRLSGTSGSRVVVPKSLTRPQTLPRIDDPTDSDTPSRS